MGSQYNNPQFPNYNSNFQDGNFIPVSDNSTTVPNYGYAPPQYNPDYRGPAQSQSAVYPNPMSGSNFNFIPNTMVPDLAFQYGSAVLGQGAGLIQKNVNQYVSLPRLKYYFAVNNAYVAKKIGLILFPFMHTKWGTISASNEPVMPGDDLNAPDLYIPFMAFITYILVSGAIFGFQGRFSPEYLGMQSSEAFGWILVEVLISLLFIYILNIKSNISYLDVIAFSGYKFVRISGLVFLYPNCQIRTLKSKLLSCADSYSTECNKRRIYLLLMIALVQPLVMWWLTRRVMAPTSV